MSGPVLVSTVLLHARCACGVVVRAVSPSTPCPDCGQARWQETHASAFGAVFQRADGWYALENLQVVSRGDAVDVLEDGTWQPTRVGDVDGEGFYVPRSVGAPVYYSFAGVDIVWRWAAGEHGNSVVGPFVTEAAARSVRYNGAPGYLLCGVCGTETTTSEVAQHYAEWHGDSLTRVVEEAPRVLRRPS